MSKQILITIAWIKPIFLLPVSLSIWARIGLDTEERVGLKFIIAHNFDHVCLISIQSPFSHLINFQGKSNLFTANKFCLISMHVIFINMAQNWPRNWKEKRTGIYYCSSFHVNSISIQSPFSPKKKKKNPEPKNFIHCKYIFCNGLGRLRSTLRICSSHALITYPQVDWKDDVTDFRKMWLITPTSWKKINSN